jgi:Protein of unknown function (DUF3040)
MPLTPEEKDALTELEQHLREDDPTLAAELARGPGHSTFDCAHVLLARRVAVLIGALVVLAVFAPVVADSFGTIGIGIVSVSLAVTWLLTTARAGARGHDLAPPARPRGSRGRLDRRRRAASPSDGP